MKKFLSIMLAAILVIACLATTVFAAGSATVSGNTATTVKGGQATVTFSISEATFANYKMKVHYESNHLKLTGLKKAGGDGTFASYIDLGNVSYAHSENETYAGALFTATFEVIDPNATCGKEYPVSVSVSYVTDTTLDEVVITATAGKIVIGHQYTSQVTPPTCGAEGYTTYTCSECRDTYTADAVSATGDHSTSTKYDANGHWEECANCDYKSNVENHTMNTQHNKTHHWEECSGCDYETSPEGHSLQLQSDKNGHWFECSCGYKNEVVGHNYEWKYDNDGHWQVCSVCGYVGTKADHAYDKTSTDGADCQTKGTVVYTCECGHTYTEYDAFGPHKYIAVVTDPTCTEKGYTTYTCSLCGDSYKDDYTDMVEHEWNKGEETKKATCGEDGEKTYTCKHCGKTKTEVIPATGEHDYEWKYDDNQHWKECSVCGHKTDAEDHNFNWVTDKKPTKTEFGEKHEECECGCVRNEGTVIDKLKDDLDEVPDTGDITPHIVLGSAALIAMLAAVAYVFKRKAVK